MTEPLANGERGEPFPDDDYTDDEYTDDEFDIWVHTASAEELRQAFASAEELRQPLALPAVGATKEPARPVEASGDVEGLTITEAASAYGVSVSTLRRRIAAGDIDGASLVPGPKGQEYRLPPASLEALGYRARETRAAEAVKAARAGLEAEALDAKVRDLEAALEVERLRREAAEGKAEALEGNVLDLRTNNATLQAALTEALSKIPALPSGPSAKPRRWWRKGD